MTFIFGGGSDDLPPEVRAWIEEQAAQAMEGFRAAHGQSPHARGDGLIDAINHVAWNGEPELDDERVHEDHEHAKHLVNHVMTLMPRPDSWGELSDADKIRVVVADHYNSMALSHGTCVHRDRVERDLLDIADRLDLDSGFGQLPAGTRVPDDGCPLEWEGKANATHFLGRHWCKRKLAHPGRCRCACGTSTARYIP